MQPVIDLSAADEPEQVPLGLTQATADGRRPRLARSSITAVVGLLVRALSGQQPHLVGAERADRLGLHPRAQIPGLKRLVSTSRPGPAARSSRRSTPPRLVTPPAVGREHRLDAVDDDQRPRPLENVGQRAQERLQPPAD